jgi:hypothetical protein
MKYALQSPVVTTSCRLATKRHTNKTCRQKTPSPNPPAFPQTRPLFPNRPAFPKPARFSRAKSHAFCPRAEHSLAAGLLKWPQAISAN